MSRFKEHYNAFLEVRDELKRRGEIHAYRICFKKPFKFYGEHSVEETVEILIKESNQYNCGAKMDGGESFE